MNLSREDYDTLLDAVDAWINKDVSVGLMEGIVGAMIGQRADEETRAKIERDADARRAKMETDRRVRQERAILLKAKLLTMRDAVDIDSLTRTTP